MRNALEADAARDDVRNMITADYLWQYLESHRRIHGNLPRLRECVEHFDGKLLNVMLCLSELSDSQKREVRQLAAEDRAARNRRAGFSNAT